jgi:replicative DNA helicase
VSSWDLDETMDWDFSMTPTADSTQDATVEGPPPQQAAEAGASERAWPVPLPLTPEPALPPFPDEILPGWLGAFVREEARATQTPVDLAAMLSLAALSGALAGRVVVEAWEGWREPTQLYVLVALPPAERKSAVFSDVFAPIHDVERDLAAENEPNVQSAERERVIADERVKRAKNRLDRGDATARQAAEVEFRVAQEALDGIVVPARPRLLADDVTPEAFSALLAEQGRVIVASAEGGLFETIGGRYSQGVPNLDAFLKAHAGERIRVDRRGAGPIYVEQATATLALAVQPQVLADLAARREFRGRGLVARFLFSVPKSRMGHREIRPRAVAGDVRQAYADGLAGLLRGLMTQRDAATRVVRLDADATAAYEAFCAQVELRLRPEGDLAQMLDWGGKLAGATLRVAAVLHAASTGPTRIAEPIGVVAVNGAITLASYLVEHARVALDLGDRARRDARRLASWCTGTPSFTEREAFAANRWLDDMTRTRSTLALLAEHHWVRLLDDGKRPGAGRPASPAWEVNPAAQNPHNPADPDSVDCVVGGEDVAST